MVTTSDYFAPYLHPYLTRKGLAPPELRFMIFGGLGSERKKALFEAIIYWIDATRRIFTYMGPLDMLGPYTESKMSITSGYMETFQSMYNDCVVWEDLNFDRTISYGELLDEFLVQITYFEKFLLSNISESIVGGNECVFYREFRPKNNILISLFSEIVEVRAVLLILKGYGSVSSIRISGCYMMDEVMCSYK